MARIDCYEEFDESEFDGRDCWSAFDLSINKDLTALAHVFPWDKENEIFRVLLRYWLPERTAEELKNIVPLKYWGDEGWITLTQGGQTDFPAVKQKILEDAEKFRCHQIRFDPFNAASLAQDLQGHAFELLEFRQTVMNYTGPTKYFERLVHASKIRHNGNPVLTWQIGNTTVWTDGNGNLKPLKPKHGDPKTIDGVQAAIMALSGAVSQTPGLRGSYYLDNPVVFI